MAGKKATLALVFLSFCGSSAGLEVTATSGQGRVVVREDSESAVLSCSSYSEQTKCSWLLPPTEDGGERRRCSWFEGSSKQCRAAENVLFNGTSTMCQVRVTGVQENQNGVWTCELELGEERATDEVELSVAKEPEVDWTGGFTSGFTVKLVKGEGKKTFGCEAVAARPGGTFFFHWGPDHMKDNIPAPDQVVNEQTNGVQSSNRSVTLDPNFDMDKKTLFCTYLQVDGEGRPIYKTQATLEIEVFALDIAPDTQDQWIGKTGENLTISLQFTASPPPQEGDMTWVVDLPEGSRPGKHEMMVPEGEGEERRTARYLVHPLRTLSGHTYQVDLTIMNVSRADEQNLHSVKMRNRISSGNSLEVEQKFTVFVDRAPIPDEGNSLILIIVIVVIVLLVLVITAAMLVVYAKKNGKWCYSSSRKPYINPDITDRKEPLVQHHPYGRPSTK